MKDILVTENVAGEEMRALQRDFDVVYEPELWRSPEKILQLIPDFRAILVRNQTQVNPELIRAGKRLIVVARAGVGLDNIDTKAATDAGIAVIYAPEQNSISVAELTIGLILALARKIPAADATTRGGRWDRAAFTGIELYGKTLGVVGLGRIGFLTAMRARALGMEIIAHDRWVNPDSFTVAEAHAKLVALDELLGQADVVSVHLPNTPETAGLFNFDRFSRMKRGAMFINTSRGEVVDEESLIRALIEKKIGGAALDVRAIEPPKSGALASMENVILTPHIAAFTVEAQQRVVASVCRDVAEVLRGGAARNFFNFAQPRARNTIA